MDSSLEIKMHAGWHIPKCPFGSCPGYLCAVAISLNELYEHRVKDTRKSLGVKKFTCGHEYGVILKP